MARININIIAIWNKVESAGVVDGGEGVIPEVPLEDDRVGSPDAHVVTALMGRVLDVVLVAVLELDVDGPEAERCLQLECKGAEEGQIALVERYQMFTLTGAAVPV